MGKILIACNNKDTQSRVQKQTSAPQLRLKQHPVEPLRSPVATLRH